MPSPNRARRRSWAQRALLVLNCLVVVACFAVAAGLLISRHYGNNIARVDLGDYTAPMPGSADDGSSTGTNGSTDESGQTAGSAPTEPDEAFPAVDPEAKNFLITGADNNDCIDPNSPYAGAFEDRDEIGERSDTIMLIRVDPASRRAAILSFPRDLWVEVRGGSHRKINETYDGDDPRPLIETIGENFYLGVNHYIQVDFCAFQTIVDAVDGVSVPFEHPAQDVKTGLYVPEPGCFTFTGDHALAYVRSRHYESMDESGQWILDPTSDLGRISRQSDFVRRVLSSALAKGFNPSAAREDPLRGDRLRRRRRRVDRNANDRVRRAAGRPRTGVDRHVPDPVGGGHDRRAVGAVATDQGRQHASHPRDLQRAGPARRCTRASRRGSRLVDTSIGRHRSRANDSCGRAEQHRSRTAEHHLSVEARGHLGRAQARRLMLAGFDADT